MEDAVVALPGVAAAAAVGRPDDEAGESIVVFYVTADGREVSPKQVLSHCRATLARHLVPREAREVSRLPLNANGKILKSELKALAVSP